MKATLTFNLDNEDDKLSYENAMQGTDAKLALWTIAQDVLRPHRKHGYKDNERLNELIQEEKVSEAIGMLEEMFYNIVNKYEVNID